MPRIWPTRKEISVIIFIRKSFNFFQIFTYFFMVCSFFSNFYKKLNLLHLNPGAAGNHGFHKIRTMLRFNLDNGAIKDLEIIELATRG